MISNPDNQSQSRDRVQKLLGNLDSAADHLANHELKTQLAEHLIIVEKMQAGKIGTKDFETSFLPEVAKMEQLAGHA
jgi:hypothetical protein